jgi:DNA polymerase-4
MDAFFVAVELLDRPELRGRPVVVGGEGSRGVVAAASYEARAYGVRSALSSVQARRLCPQAVFLPGRHARYREVSAVVMGIFGSYTPLVEPISLDEAFLDVTGAQRARGDGPAIAAAIRADVARDLALTCSVGVAPSKLVAKLASEAAKPKASPRGAIPGRGVVEVAPGEVLGFLHPLPVQALWGVGPATLDRLGRLGVATVGDLAAAPLEALVAALGRAHGTHLHQLARGVDERPVEPGREVKSVGHEETFAADLHDRAAVERQAVRMADAVSSRLREAGRAGRTVTVKVRFHDFRTITRSITLGAAVDTAPSVARAAKGLLAAVDPAPGVRLLGVSVSGLTEGGARQLSFDDAAWTSASGAVDEIRDRFGPDAIGSGHAPRSNPRRARELDPEPIPRVVDRGIPWDDQDQGQGRSGDRPTAKGS